MKKSQLALLCIAFMVCPVIQGQKLIKTGWYFLAEKAGDGILVNDADGRKKWIEAQKRISKTNESIMFVFADKVYFEKFIYGESKTTTSFIDLFIEQQIIEDVFKLIKAEINSTTITR